VPPFALFEFVPSQFRKPSRADNAKSGTCVENYRAKPSNATAFVAMTER
jgi:hypothetical protein